MSGQTPPRELDPPLRISVTGIERLLIAADSALQQANLAGGEHTPDRRAALCTLALVVAQARDRAQAAGDFLGLALPLLVTSEAQQSILLQRFSSPDASTLVTDIFGPDVAVAPRPPVRMRSAPSRDDARVGDDADREAAGLLQTPDSRGASQPEPRAHVPLWQRLLAFHLWITSLFHSDARRARLVRQRVSAAAAVFSLVVPAVKNAPGGRRDRRAAGRTAAARTARLSNSFDVERTIRATVARAGLFTPRWRVRWASAEYVFLVHQVSQTDLEYARVHAALEDLREQGAALTIYPYQVDPRRLTDSLAGTSSASVSLAELFERHPSARLVLVTEARELVNPFTLEPWDWTCDLLRWARRALFTSLPSADWGRIESAIHHSLGFSIASLRDNGLRHLSALLGGSGPIVIHDSERAAVTPIFAASPDARYVADEIPDDEARKRLLLELRLYLGERAFQWLALCAFFPALTPEIALYFGRRLAAKRGPISERQFADDYIKLASLPWMRHGYMPDWMRHLVIGTLAPAQQGEARRIAASILDAANLTPDQPTLQPTSPLAPGGDAPVVLPIRLDRSGSGRALDVDDLTIAFLNEGEDRDISPVFELTPERIAELLERHRETVKVPSRRDKSTPASPLPGEDEIPSQPPAEDGGATLPPETAPAADPRTGSVQIYISYARDDDTAPSDAPNATGFVTFLSEQLDYAFRNRRPQPPKIWRDRANIQASGAQFEPAIYEAISNSDILLVVLSPNWLSRPYCRQELQSFADRWKHEGPAAVRRRIVVVRKSNVDRDALPSLLQGQEDYPFVAFDGGSERELFVRGKVRNERYYAVLEGLAGYLLRLSDRLRPFDAASSEEPQPASGHQGKTIYLICRDEDSRFARELARSLNAQLAEPVLPLFDGTPAERSAHHRQMLAECHTICIIWGAASEVWVRTTARELREVRLRPAGKPLYSALIAAPPPSERKTRFASWQNEEFDTLVDFSTGELNADTVAWLANAAGRTAETVVDTVDVSVFAPDSGRPGDTVLVQVLLHRQSDADAAKSLAMRSDGNAKLRGVGALTTDLTRGSALTIELDALGATSDESTRTATWRGDVLAQEFRFTLPATQRDENNALRVRVFDNSVPIGNIPFLIRAKTPSSEPTTNTSRFRRAFLSYASQDRARVMNVAQRLTSLGIEFFGDLLSLDPSEQWAGRILREIDRCDLFILFWSTAAARSEWVMREAEYALKRQATSPDGLPYIAPVILEGPPVPSLPPSLTGINFNDSLGKLLGTEPEGASTADGPTPNAEQRRQQSNEWIDKARPVLEMIKDAFDSMKWSQSDEPDPQSFEGELRRLFSILPVLPTSIDVELVKGVLDQYLKRTIHHGIPIPDDYHYSPILPERGSLWGIRPREVEACLRPGLNVREHQRENLGGLTEGDLIAPELIFAASTS